MSLSQGKVPATLKEAMVTPLLKKQSLYPDVLLNYRSVSNLPQLSKKDTILVMVDLNSAFDTIDHSILLSRSELRYGITSVVLEWFISYLYGRVQRVNKYR